MRVKLEEVCKRIYAGGDVPKDRFSEEKTEEYPVPIYANAEKDNGLYGYTDKAREEELSITVAARGTIGFTAIRREPFLPVVRLITVVPDTEKVSVRYLYYVLKNCKPQSSGTSIPQLTVPDIKKNSLELYDISEQEQIADQLDRVNRVIELRKQELESLDELIKARFVELFGDPIMNPMSWEKKRFDEICENLDSRRKPISSGDRVEGIYPYYGASGIVDYVEDYIFDEDILLVSEDGANLLMRSTPIAFSVSGKVWVNNHAHVVRFDEMSLQKYVEIYFSLIDISENITGSAQPKLNQAKLNAMMIPIPEKTLLEQYREFLKQIDKSKVAVQKALDETQLLFDSLMQNYFG